MKIGFTSPKHILIYVLNKKLGDVIRSFEDRLPEPDSYFTNNDYAIVVSEVDETTLATGCAGKAIYKQVDVTIYERTACGEAGTIEAVDAMICEIAKGVLGKWQAINISNIFKESGRPLPYIDENFRARVSTYAINYEVCT